MKKVQLAKGSALDIPSRSTGVPPVMGHGRDGRATTRTKFTFRHP